MNIETVLFDPESPGRGPNPRYMGEMYRWERVGDFPIVGRFAGVLLGTTKGADAVCEVEAKGWRATKMASQIGHAFMAKHDHREPHAMRWSTP